MGNNREFEFYILGVIQRLEQTSLVAICYTWMGDTLSCIELLTFQFAWVIKLWSWHLQIQFIHILPTHSFEDEKQSFEDERQSFENEKQSFENEKQSFMTSWQVFFSDWIFFEKEVFSLDKFWFCEWTQNTFKPLVWHLLHQNMLIINDFMKVYEESIIFIKWLIFNIFWWKKCQTIGLKVFWVDLWN